MIEVNDLNYDEFVKSNDVVVLKYHGTWCGPCKALNPIIEDISMEHTDVKFGSVDIDENRSLTTKYGVRSIPTMLVFKNGEVVDKLVGAHPKETITSKLEPYLN